MALPLRSGLAACRNARQLFSAAASQRHRYCQPRLMFGGSGGSGSGGRGFRVGAGGNGGGGDAAGTGGLWDQYLRMLEQYPVLTKGATCAVLNAAGDVACQLFLEKKTELDLHRLAVFSGLGAVLVGPTLHFWYLTLSKLVRATGTSGALIRMAWDQLVFAPSFNALFIAALFTVNGQAHLVRAKLEQDLLTTVKANWILWVPAQFVNFRFVPQHLQVLFANVIALAWNTYLSYASHKEVPEAAAK